MFERLLKIINDDTDNTSLLEMDSTFCKVHQSACSALKDQAIGSSRVGKNTKVHFLLNERMQLLKVILTGEQVHDSEAALALIEVIKLKGKKILADKAYSSEQIRGFIVERFFQQIKSYCHVATRYDKLAVYFENFVLLVASVFHF